MAQLGVEIEVTSKDWVDGAIRWLRGCAARSIAKHGFKVRAR